MSPDAFSKHYLSNLNKYIKEVLNNTRIVGKKERQAVERYKQFLTKFDYREKELIKRLKFLSLINLPLKGKGAKQMILADWQVFMLANVYCFFHPETDDRVIKQVVVSGAG